MPVRRPWTRVRLTHRKKIGPGDAAMAKPRAKPLSTRLNTAILHGRANCRKGPREEGRSSFPLDHRPAYSPDVLEIARNVLRHKLRSVLTISGILIGVLALTTMGALAENFNALIDGGVKYYSGSIQVGAP